MAILPDEPRLGDTKLPDPLPSGGLSRNVYTLIAVAIAILLVAYLLGGPWIANSPLGPPPMP